MTIIGICISIAIFSLVILVHEYGHYSMAKRFGMKIEEFGLGIPPRAKILWKNAAGTLFSLNWIPLGGFVRIAGESDIAPIYYDATGKQLSDTQIRTYIATDLPLYFENGDEISESDRGFLAQKIAHLAPEGQNFYEKSLWQKSIVLLAGVTMNFLLAVIILSFLFGIGVQPIGINTVIETPVPSKLLPNLETALNRGILIENPGVILFPLPDSRAHAAGVVDGDILTAIDTLPIESISEAQKYITDHADIPMTLSLTRTSPCPENTPECSQETSKIQLGIIPDSSGKIGSYLAPNYEVNTDFMYNDGFFTSLKDGFVETYAQIRLTLSGLHMLLKNIFTPDTPQDREEALDQVAGPIGIVTVITHTFTQGWKFVFLLTALISINLGVFNLLPIPALDGGRLLLMWVRSGIEAIFGKNQRVVSVENSLNIFFFLVLIALSVLIAYNDIIKIFTQ